MSDFVEMIKQAATATIRSNRTRLFSAADVVEASRSTPPGSPELDERHRFRGYHDGIVFELTLGGRAVMSTGCPRCAASILPEGDYEILAFRRDDPRRQVVGSIRNYGDGVFVVRTASGIVIDSSY